MHIIHKHTHIYLYSGYFYVLISCILPILVKFVPSIPCVLGGFVTRLAHYWQSERAILKVIFVYVRHRMFQKLLWSSYICALCGLDSLHTYC